VVVVAGERGRPDRRRHPRVPANLPVLVIGGGRIIVGRTRDASEGGIAVAVTTPLPQLPRDVTVAIRLPTQGWSELHGQIVRCEREEAADGLLGIRLSTAGCSEPAPPGRPPPARGRARLGRTVGHERSAFEAELRALATLVYEQALNEPQARPLRSLVMWSNHLHAQLGVDSEEPASYRDLLRGLATLHRCSGRRARRRS